MSCECDTPCPVPFETVDATAPRERLLCAACGQDWLETDDTVINRVHAENERYERQLRADDESLPRCAKHQDGHRFVAMRNGNELCRDCGKQREALS